MEQRTFNQLLAASIKNGASDVHLKVGAPPALRINGSLLPVRVPAMQGDDMQKLAGYITHDAGWKGDLRTLQDLDTSYQIEGVGRFRVNIFRSKNHLGMILRVISEVVPTIDGLGLPPVLKKICEESRGLILITGVTGSGKSSTLAAMIDEMNSRNRNHILTIEDPIEFVHTDKLARLTQREIGPDSPDFARALKSALRQDPDTILVGEMRDLETVDIAMKAAETGHLVLSTLHTNDAAKTITRLVEVYPHEAHDGVRSRIAENLKAIVGQRLVPRADGKGRVVALEILVATETMKEYIKENRLGEITEYLSKNTDVYGTQSFDQHLSALYREGIITLATAKATTTNPSDFERALSFN